jgi:hypothetical protein
MVTYYVMGFQCWLLISRSLIYAWLNIILRQESQVQQDRPKRDRRVLTVCSNHVLNKPRLKSMTG